MRWRKSRRATAGSTHRTRRPRFEVLEDRRVLAAPVLLNPVTEVNLYAGSPIYIALDGFDADGEALSFTATSSNPDITTYIPQGNRSMSVQVRSANGAIEGEMVFELFEDRVPRVTSRIIELAESGFYDGVIFHRVINNFMIQGGDPTGTGSGGSELGDFDDQFHVDLQHNRSGILSMAKSIDDTNDSQFFITDTVTTENEYALLRNLDFNHSIFGQLVEGDAIREAISHVALADGTTRPAVDVVMQSVQIYRDQQNAVVMLKAPAGYRGEADITITIYDSQGTPFVQQPIHVTITPDPDAYSEFFDSDPFLADIPEIRTTADTPVQFQLQYIDADSEGAIFLDQYALNYFGLSIPFVADGNLVHEVDFETGLTTVSPTNGLVGTHGMTVATAYYDDAIDYQVVPIHIAPATAPSSTLDMTLVRDLTATDALGEVDALPADQWIDEWDSFAIEVWAKIDDPGAYGVHEVSTELTYDTSRFTATHVEYGPEFREHAEAEIDAQAGRVSQIAGSTRGVLVDFYGSETNATLEFFGDDAYLLVARVFFDPNTSGPGVPLGNQPQYCAPVTDLGFAFENAQIKWNSVDETTVQAGTLADAELWPVIYDIDDDDFVTLADLSYFVVAYTHQVGEAGNTWGWASDFDRDGWVTLGDLSYFVPNYLRGSNTPGRSTYPPNFPAAWRPVGDAASVADASDPSGDAAGSEETSSETPRQAPLYAAALDQAAASARRGARPSPRPPVVDLLMGVYDG
ncbi:MAG: peptidylprolyl isomerase [Pirellulales bacterium]|nr:peptidylprolyl isomerase [Pirellulales bacterium]